MEGIICVIVALGVFNIATNIAWFVTVLRLNNDWMNSVIGISEKQLNNYKELLQSIVNGEDNKDEGDNVF